MKLQHFITKTSRWGVRSGLLYEKSTNKLITTALANEVYLSLYNQSKQAV